MSHVVRGDFVIVISGQEKGKKGKIKRVFTKKGRIEVEKTMMIKKHTKASQKDPQGGIKDIEGTIAIDNVLLFCDSCSAGRRTKKVVDGNGNKQRACIKCDTTFPNPGM